MSKVVQSDFNVAETESSCIPVVMEIGKAAGVKVSPTKCASAHDLRRSFGFRCAMRVMPVLLQKWMRHANIETTLKFYVGNDAREMGRAVWRAFRATAKTATEETEEQQKGNTLGNTTPRPRSSVG